MEFPGLDGYLRSAAINFGLTGVLCYRTPREMIEGYNDPLIEALAQLPIYLGGDNTTSPVLSMLDPPTHPTDNQVAFFTGEDDYKMTRVYGEWLGQEFIMIKGKEYKSLNDIQEFIFSPWPEKVLLDGTDGMQF